MLGHLHDIEGKANCLIRKAQNLEKRLKVAEEQIMAWLGYDENNPLNYAKEQSQGSGESRQCAVVFDGDDYYLAEWDAALYDTEPGVIPYLHIYKNGALQHSIALFTDIGGSSTTRYSSVCPVTYRDGYFFYVHGSAVSNRLALKIYKYKLSTGVSTLTDTEWADDGTTELENHHMAVGIDYDPIEDVFYAVGSVVKTGGGTSYTLRIWQLDTDGVADHRVSNPTATYAENIALFPSNGTVYFMRDTPNNVFFQSVAGASVDATSFTTIAQDTGYDHSNGPWIGPYGLYIRPSSLTTLRVAAITWDLSSYLDSYHNIAFLQKIDGDHNYYAITIKAGTAYCLKLANAGTLTNLGSKSLSVAADYQVQTYSGAWHERGSTGLNPLGDFLALGTAIKQLHINIPNRDVL